MTETESTVALGLDRAMTDDERERLLASVGTRTTHVADVLEIGYLYDDSLLRREAFWGSHEAPLGHVKREVVVAISMALIAADWLQATNEWALSLVIRWLAATTLVKA